MTAARLIRPRVLMLDAGNTVVFLDYDALSSAARAANLTIGADALRRAEPVAKRRYEAGMTSGMSHEDGWHLHMRVIYEEAGLTANDAARAAEAAWREHERFNLWRSVPGDLICALERAHAAGVRTAIVSNSEGRLAALLERLDLTRFFELVIDSGIEGVRKPDPEIFRRALSRLRVAPEHALYAGDIPQVDVDGARAAGMAAALIDGFDHYPDYQDAPRFPSVAALIDALV